MAKKKNSNAPMVLLLIAILIAILVLIGSVWWLAVVTGSLCPGTGEIVSEERKVGEFHSVRLEGSGNLYVTQDKMSSVVIEAEDTILPRLKTSVENGVLVIKDQGFFCFGRPIDVYLSMDEIKSLAVSGSGKIIGQTLLESEALEMKITGSGKIDANVKATLLETIISGSGESRIRGAAGVHTIRISGSGRIESYDLLTTRSDIIVSGSGKAEIHAIDNLDVTISGSGKVIYKGEPVIDQTISGSGKIQAYA